MLANAIPMGFLAVGDFARARTFYGDVLGLEFVSQDAFALVFRCGPIFLRLTVPPNPLSAPYTVFGWRVGDIDAAVAALAARGIVFRYYPFFGEAQRADGVWIAPNGDKVAWFTDPDGNLLSLSQHSHDTPSPGS
jgi:catechol 2,3-dioxygenase-like lactoylglutathione lyase family enzyme